MRIKHIFNPEKLGYGGIYLVWGLLDKLRRKKGKATKENRDVL